VHYQPACFPFLTLIGHRASREGRRWVQAPETPTVDPSPTPSP
jgi:hypothetical protein